LKKIRVFPLFYIREIGNLEEKNYDLCISRSGVEWGIRIPEKIEKDLKLSRSVFYVSF